MKGNVQNMAIAVFLLIVMIVVLAFLVKLERGLAAPQPTMQASPHPDMCARLLCAGERPSFCPPPIEMPELMCAKFQPRRVQ